MLGRVNDKVTVARDIPTATSESFSYANCHNLGSVLTPEFDQKPRTAMDNRKIETPAAAEIMDGVVTFGPSPSPADRYRFQISLNEDKMNIWLENLKTKTQWKTKDLSLDDFVQTNGVLPQAKMVDYMKCFRNALVFSSDSEECQRDLQSLKNGHLSLEITLKLKLFESLWSSTYEFELIPIPLEKADILESTVRDLQDKLTMLEEQGSKKPVYLHATGTKSVGKNGTVLWDQVDEDCFKIDALGTIEFLVSGVYMVHVVVRHVTTLNGEAFHLLKGTQVVGQIFAACNSGYNISSPLMVTLKMKTHEKLSVTYTGNSQVHPGSYFTAFLLG